MFRSPVASLLLLPADPLKHDMVELGAVPLLGVAADAPCLLDGAFPLLVAVTLLLPLLEYAAPAAVSREAVVAPLILLASFRRPTYRPPGIG